MNGSVPMIHRTSVSSIHGNLNNNNNPNGTLSRRPLLTEDRDMMDTTRPCSAASGRSMMDGNPNNEAGDVGITRRHLSFTRMTYNLPTFNEEFDMVRGNKRGFEPCGAGTAALGRVSVIHRH